MDGAKGEDSVSSIHDSHCHERGASPWHEGLEDTKDTKEVIMLRVSSPLSPEAEAIVTETVDCAFTVHRILGPGFRELIYERAPAAGARFARNFF